MVSLSVFRCAIALARFPIHSVPIGLVFLALAVVPVGAQNQLWIEQIGTVEGDMAEAAAPDGSGGVYLGGHTDGDLAVPSAGGKDAWFAHYDGSGNQLWLRQIGTDASDFLYAAAPDGSGGVYVCGSTWGNFGGPNAGSRDAWLARFDSAGNQLWVTQFGTTADDILSSAAPDGSGGVYVGGHSDGNLGGMNVGGRDAWFAHYDGVGNQLWNRQLGTSADDRLRFAVLDSSGGVYLGGHTDGDLGGPNAGYRDAWIARYDGAGNQLWLRQIGTDASEFSNAAAPDGSGGVYVCGSTRGSLGGPSAGSTDAWLARYDGAGNQHWIRQFGKGQEEFVAAAAPDSSGGVYVGGHTDGNLGGTNAGGYDSWFAHYDTLGNSIWLRQLGTNANDILYAAAPDGSGGVYPVGHTWGSLGGPSSGLDDAWLARYDSCGSGSSYCTAKPNSCGGLPAISSTGTPSASLTSGFNVHSTGARQGKPGLLMYSPNGRASLPFQGGTLCVSHQGIRRGEAVFALGGTVGTACDAVFSVDWNSFAVGQLGGTPAPFLRNPGQRVNVQWWGRDSLVAGSYLSNGLEYTVCP